MNLLSINVRSPIFEIERSDISIHTDIHSIVSNLAVLRIAKLSVQIESDWKS
jgi:hypothetical protein